MNALIDQLLASPHYGERWGRHWLDVVRFGESQGFERDKLRYDIASYLFPQRTVKPVIAIIMGEDYAGRAGYSVAQSNVSTTMLRKLFVSQGFTVLSGAEIEAQFAQQHEHCTHLQGCQ